MFCLVILMGNYCLPFHFSYRPINCYNYAFEDSFFLIYYLVVPPIVHIIIFIILVSLIEFNIGL